MSKPMPRMQEIFFEVYESLPRQGPGNRSCATRALSVCSGLPPTPAILDLGCGIGGQTLHLVELTAGMIVAIDSHEPSIKRLQATAAARGIADRIRPLVGDMAHPGLQSKSFDLIWSEGAFYNIGIESALRACRGLLRPTGYLVFTDAVWQKDDPPCELKAIFEAGYPSMGGVPDVLTTIETCGFSLVHHFTLPGEAWWADFYTPMERRIEELRRKYTDDAEALVVLDQLAQEPEMYRRYSDYYAYEFFVTRLSTETKVKSPQTNGICERLHKTVLQELYQVTFRN
jgi:SAM-dependent methyltransferase